MTWTFTFNELFNTIGQGFLNLFGSPTILGVFVLGIFIWYSVIFGLSAMSMLVLGVSGLLVLSFSGVIKSWVGYTVLIVVGTYVGLILARRFG